MRSFVYILLILCLPIQAAFYPAIGEQYMIECLEVGTGGVVAASSGIYPLVYDSEADASSLKAYWIITEEQAGKYSFMNVETNRYIKYNPALSAAKFIEMTDKLSGDASLFSLLPQIRNGVEYFAIVSLADNGQYMDKRSYAAVGTYAGRSSGNDNQLFRFVAKNGSTVIDRNLYGYLYSLTFNSNPPALCTSTNNLYVSLPLEQMSGNNVEMTIGYQMKQSDYTLKINDIEIQNDEFFTFTDISATRTFKLEIVQDDVSIASCDLIFTGLPIVQLYSSETLTSEFSRAAVRVHEPEKSKAYALLNAEMRYRGATALSYKKKSFALKVKDANWQNLDTTFMGMREDKYWILDAMAMDRSRMRNRVSTDLWNDFSTAPYFKEDERKMINGTRGKYVEVFLDDQYWGLYCMTERVDRKQLKLKKYDDSNNKIKGVLYKSGQWSYSVMMGYVPNKGPDPNKTLTFYNNTSLTWDGYEASYPDLEDGDLFDWKPLYDVVSFVAKSSNSDFSATVAQQVDLPVWLDYYLLMELILATDNHGKNAYLYMYDITQERKLGICVWDMDGVWGIRWDRNRVAASQDYTDLIVNDEHGEHNLFRRLKAGNISNFNTLKKLRYDALRFTSFTPDNLFHRFETYKNIFDLSGVADREKKRWSGIDGINIDFDNELDYIEEWVFDRCRYLNNAYGEPASIDNTSLSSFIIHPNPVEQELFITNSNFGNENFEVKIFDSAGQEVIKNRLTNGRLDVNGLKSGIYLIKSDIWIGRFIKK